MTELETAFFSYSREDSDFARKLASDLKASGAHVWMDQLDIEPGTPWDDAISQALHSSPRVLVILSPTSAKSENVADEVGFALSNQKHVIPVLYRDCEVPFRLARLQHIDMRSDYDAGLQELTRTLALRPVPVVSGSVGEAEPIPAPAINLDVPAPVRTAPVTESVVSSGGAKKAALIGIPVLLLVLIAAYFVFRTGGQELDVTILAPPNFTAPRFEIDGKTYPLQGQNVHLKLAPGEHRFTFPKIPCGGTFNVSPDKTTFMPVGHDSTDCALKPFGN